MTSHRIVFPAVGHCEIERFEVPDAPPADAVLLRVQRTLVSPGTELAVFTGRHSNIGKPNAWPQFPFHPGYSVTGEVIAVGDNVSQVRPGDTVFAEASHTSYAVVPKEKVLKVAPALGLERPTFTELSAIALQGVRLGEVALGERVAVFGQGLVGLLALRLARCAGATRLATFDLDEARLALSRRFGADVAASPASETAPADVIRAATGGHLADVVIEATGNPAVIAACLACARTEGRVVLLGAPHGTATINFYEHVVSRNLRLVGAHIARSEFAATPAAPWNRDRNRLTFLDLLERGDIPVEDLVTHRIAPGDLPDFYRNPADFSGALGVIVDWEND